MKFSVQIAFLPLAELRLFGESPLSTQCFLCAIRKQSLLGGAATLPGRSQVHTFSAFHPTSSVPTKEEGTMLYFCLWEGQDSMEPQQSELKDPLKAFEFKSRLLPVAGPSNHLFQHLASVIIKWNRLSTWLELLKTGQMVLHGSSE